ncbi:MAG: hypothetical protein AAF672_12885 [Pseudomonadota bacterium]
MVFLKRLARWAGLFLLALIALPILAFLVWVAKGLLIDNPRYAHRFFTPIFASFEVLESKQWHPFGASGWDCSYAIVSLPESVASDPPMPARGVSWQFRWGGENWEPTPMQPLGDTTRDAIDACSGYWSAEALERLRAALNAPGSFVLVGSVGETVFVYSKPQRLAARVRYGD